MGGCKVIIVSNTTTVRVDFRIVCVEVLTIIIFYQGIFGPKDNSQYNFLRPDKQCVNLCSNLPTFGVKPSYKPGSQVHSVFSTLRKHSLNHSLNHNYNLIGFDTIEINLVVGVIDDVGVGIPNKSKVYY